MQIGVPAVPIKLSPSERTRLKQSSRRKTARGLVLCFHIFLACAEGKANMAVVEELGTGRLGVGNSRKRFVERRLDGLADEPRPGVSRKITDDQLEAVVIKTLERPGQAERRADEYRRHGATSLFAALDVKTDNVIGEYHRRHRAEEFRKFLKILNRSDQEVPKGGLQVQPNSVTGY